MIGDIIIRPDAFQDYAQRNKILLLTKLASFGALSLKEVRRYVLWGNEPAEVRALIARLTEEGLLTVERVGLERVPDQPSVRLTTAGWEFALNTTLHRARGESWERLAQLAIIATHRHAAAPNAHRRDQHDTKRLLLAFDSHPDHDFFMPWAANWQPAFPSDVRGVLLPDPSYVGVANVDGREILIFGECDNTIQPLGAFRKKMEMYAQLARRPDFVEQIFGYRDFHVWVTVADPVQRAPMVRMRELIDIARQEGTSRVTSFTQQHWALWDSTWWIWFMNGEMPRSNSQVVTDHDNTHRYVDIADTLSHALDEESLRWHRRLNSSPKIPRAR